MSPAESLSLLLASGVQAEAVVRATVESLDTDWHGLTDDAADLSDLDAARLALAKMEALAPYRALLGAVVATWDTGNDDTSGVVKIGGAS